MSRSHKHTFICTDNSNSKEMRKVANKIVNAKLKNTDILPQHSQYKKLFNSYNICDYKLCEWDKSEKIIKLDRNKRKYYYNK